MNPGAYFPIDQFARIKFQWNCCIYCITQYERNWFSYLDVMRINARTDSVILIESEALGPLSFKYLMNGLPFMQADTLEIALKWSPAFCRVSAIRSCVQFYNFTGHKMQESHTWYIRLSLRTRKIRCVHTIFVFFNSRKLIIFWVYV